MTNKKLNILLLASWYPSASNPNEGSFIMEQATLLRENGFDVTVVHPFMLGTFFNTLGKRTTVHRSNECEIKTIHVGVPPIFPGLRLLSYVICYRKMLATLSRLKINIRDFDLIHSHSVFMGGYMAYRISKDYLIPYVHTEHASGLIFNPMQYNSNELKLIRNIYLKASAVLFVSRFSLNKTVELFGGSANFRFIVLPNLVHDEFFKPTKTLGRIPVNFLMVGDFIPVKNHDLLLQAWVQVQNQCPDVVLTLMGEGIDKFQLAKSYLQLNLNKLIVLPRISREEVLTVMSKQHCVISTSLVETFGLSIAEAQALGLPAVVTNSGGVRDIITQETGIITEPNAKAFADGIIQMIDKYDKFDALRIRQITKDRFSSEVIMNQLNSVYQRVQ